LCRATTVARFLVVQHTKNIPNNTKISQNVTKYTNWSQNRPNGHKIYQHVPSQDPSKYTKIWIFWVEKMPSGNPSGTTQNSGFV
jgi:hypothetical protein